MARLVLVNGPPGSGKSTVTALLAAEEAMTTAIDLDVIKHGLTMWPADPVAAGLEARRRALLLAAAELRSGHHVVVGQYLARTDFVELLEALAQREGARFVEIFLDVDLATLATRLGERARRPDRPEHTVNNRLVSPGDAASLLASLADVVQRRPEMHRVDASGSVDDTVAKVREVIRGT